MKTEIVFLNTCKSTNNIYLSKFIINDAKINTNLSVHYAMYYNVIDVCMNLNRPILVCLDGQEVNVDIVRLASQYCESCVLWTFEDPYAFHYNEKNLDLFDLVFSNDEKTSKLYGEKGIFLPLASPSELCQMNDLEKKYDIFFCGSAWPNRVVYLNRLLTDLPNLNFKIVLSYNKHLPLLPLNLNDSAYVGRVSFDDFINYSLRSKITLNLNRCFSSSKDNDPEPSNYGPRFFEIASIGAVQILDKIDNNLNFDDVATFSSYDELLEKINDILNDYGTYKDKASKLRTKVKNDHTYINRINTIIDCIKHRQVSLKCINNSNSVSYNQNCLLFVVHNVRDSSNFGGLEVHQESIANYLKQYFRILYFTVKELDGVRCGVVLDTDYNVINISEPILNLSHDNISNPSLEKFFSYIVLSHSVKLVHFFHFINNCPSLCEISHALKIPYSISIHDFYCICIV